MSFLELAMMICFGLSWPASLYKAYKSRSTAGKSALFSLLILIGYICGIINKFLHGHDFVTIVYLINACMVTTDLLIWLRNRRLECAEQQSMPAVQNGQKGNSEFERSSD